MAKQKTAGRRTARPKDSGSEKAKSGSGNSGSTYEEELTELLQERIKPNLNRGSIPLLARSLAKDIAARQRTDEAEEDEPRDEAADDQPETDDEAQGDDERDEEPEAEAGDDSAEEQEEPEDEEQDSEVEDEDSEPEAVADEDEDEDEDEDLDDEDEDSEPEGEGEGGGEDPVSVFEEEMHQLQEDLGDEWIVRFSVQNDEAWLTAEKEDGSQHVEGPTADVLREAVELLEGGGESED